MRNSFNSIISADKRINYRGTNPSRMENLTDAVFGIAITLLIFNLANPDSFSDLITFTKTLPAFLLSISFLVLVWNEHRRFFEIYSNNDSTFTVLNTIFIALIIFFVFPLRFLTLFLTQIIFQFEIALTIEASQVPWLMVYYAGVIFALYFTIFLFYGRAYRIREKLGLNDYELFLIGEHKFRLAILYTVPLFSIILTIAVIPFSPTVAAITGGMIFWLYTPGMIIWSKRFKKREAVFNE